MKERFLILDQSEMRFHKLTDQDLPTGEDFDCTDDVGKAENSQARRARKFKPTVYV